MNRAVIGIGANLDPANNIERAREAIARQHVILGQSQTLETTPIGCAQQPNYLNTALLVETTQTREAMRCELRAIEHAQGRVRTANKYDPRPIDLDIVVWNGEVVDDDVYARDFLRAGVRELWPDLEL